jgi:alpha-D-xyloside xylohydrolase
MTTRAVYEGQRAASDQKRVFILSRSAFAGDQRYGVTAWSGDVLSDWLSYKRQIPAGLNYSVSGLPYWTTDIGGFISGGNLNDPNFRELFIRWFQFGAFSPIFRVHGTRSPDENELWSYGPDAEKILLRYDNLRYRLLPYIYSLAWKTTSESYTPMRPLVMDFREDVNAQNVGDHGESGDRAGRAGTASLSSQVEVVRLLDGRTQQRSRGWRQVRGRSRAHRPLAALRTRWFHYSARPGRRIFESEAR